MSCVGRPNLILEVCVKKLNAVQLDELDGNVWSLFCNNIIVKQVYCSSSTTSYLEHFSSLFLHN
jgi:hypothetical protein